MCRAFFVLSIGGAFSIISILLDEYVVKDRNHRLTLPASITRFHVLLDMLFMNKWIIMSV